MNILNVCGLAAAVVSFVMFVPQAARVWRLRHDGEQLKGVSQAGQWMLIANAALWAVYGIGMGAYWTAIPSFVNAPLAAVTLYLLRVAPSGSAATPVQVLAATPGPSVSAAA